MIQNIIIAALVFTAPNGIVNFCNERAMRKNMEINHHIMAYSGLVVPVTPKNTVFKKNKNTFEPFNSNKNGGGPNNYKSFPTYNYISHTVNKEIEDIDRRIKVLKTKKNRLIKKINN